MWSARRLRQRRKRRAGETATRIGGIALVATGIVAILALLWFRPKPIVRDPATMCPEVGPARVTAVLIDSTDRIGRTSQADVLGRLDDMIQRSAPDEMLLAYETLRSDQLVHTGLARLLPPRLQVCNPGDPDTTSPWTSNPELIRRRLDERFRQPLAAIFEQLVNGTPSSTSPIMETVQAISVDLLARLPYEQLPKRVVLVSDLVQHSEYLSLYDSSQIDYDVFASSSGAAALRTNLTGVAVEILPYPTRF